MSLDLLFIKIQCKDLFNLNNLELLLKIHVSTNEMEFLCLYWTLECFKKTHYRKVKGLNVVHALQNQEWNKF